MRSYIYSTCLYDHVLFKMGGGSQSSHTTTTQELSPEQRALLEGVIPIAQGFLANPPKQYPGTAIEGFDPLQKQAQQMTLNAAGQMQPTLNKLPGQIQGMQPGLNFLTSGDVLKASSNPYLQSAITAATRPTVEKFQEEIMPQLRLGSVGTGAFGGTRSEGIASGIAAGKATTEVGDIAAEMSNANYQKGLDAMLQGQQNQTTLMQNTGSILSQMMLPATMTEAVGGQRQAMNQALLSEAAQRYVNEQMIPFSAAQDVAAMAMGMPGGTTASTSTSTGGGGASGMQMAQLGIGGASALLPLLMKSDRRLKENVKLVARLYDGLNVYTFKYIGEHATMHLGLMADEVEELYPEAVFKMRDGYKLLDYNAVPSWPLEGMPQWSIH